MPTLSRTQILPISQQEAWEFFSSPYNLAKITPAYMRFNILNNPPRDTIYKGLIIEYTVRPVLQIPLYWKTEISDVIPGEQFTDTQLKGPYRQWIHTHRFIACDEGVRMEDHVSYELPFGILGKLAQMVFVKRQVESIFDYREQILNALFKK